MKVGIIAPQGWIGEYDGWETLTAWRRTVQVARQAEALGFESVWLFDHFHTAPRPTSRSSRSPPSRRSRRSRRASAWGTS
jgi:alkanesulfonate monooxygenase SsuD/methylene tetrahydromethanopterin reductase-like flavin-dependent oxidoreductase (luciferase family)